LLDLERLYRVLSARFGAKIDPLEVAFAPGEILKLMRRLEDYWERGAGTEPASTGPLHDNLAVWGFEVLDALTLTDGICHRCVPKARNNLLNQVPEFSMYRTAARVLNPRQNAKFEDLTQLGLAKQIAREEGGIENLLVALGSNNVLGTCTSLKLTWSQSADFRKLPHQREATIWEPEHFARIYDRLAKEIKDVGAKNVFVATVPHVTIPPVTRGISRLSRRNNQKPQDAEGYFEYYTRFWIWDDKFDPDRDPCLRREDAKTIDGVIDAYNEHIRKVALENDWHVVPFCELLDSLAFRRRQGKVAYKFPTGLLQALQANGQTRHRVRGDGTVLLDSRSFRIPKADQVPRNDAPSSEWQKAYKGGLFGLDGVHPTTVGYGLVAHELLTVMKAAHVAGADETKLPWDEIVQNDNLLVDSPEILASLQDTLSYLFSRQRLDRVLMQASGYGSQPLA
jgi:hypothetical protein